MGGDGRRLPIAGRPAGAGAPAAFSCVVVVSLGAAGGSLAMALRRAWPEALVIGVDRNDVLESAVRRQAIDVGADDLSLIAGGADLVVLSGSAAENRGALARLAGAVPGSTVITELGGGTGAIGHDPVNVPGRLDFVGGLLTPRPAEAGFEAASAGYFDGRVWYLASDTAGADVMDRLQQMVRAVGATPAVVPPDEFRRLVQAQDRPAGAADS